MIIGLFLFIAIALPLSLISSKDTALAGAPPVVSGIPKPEETYQDRPASMDVRDTVIDPADIGPADTPSGAQNSGNVQDAASVGIVENKPAGGGALTITIVPAAPVAQAPAAAQPQPAPPSVPRAPQSASSSGKSQTAPPKQAAPKPVTTAAKPPSSSVLYDFWIQTGAFSTRAHAENIQKALKEKGQSSTIMDTTVNGKNVFRVRTGPYINYSEASYWLKLIKVIDIAGLEESWIDQVVK